jgi:hypothetical protein
MWTILRCPTALCFWVEGGLTPWSRATWLPISDAQVWRMLLLLTDMSASSSIGPTINSEVIRYQELSGFSFRHFTKSCAQQTPYVFEYVKSHISHRLVPFVEFVTSRLPSFLTYEIVICFLDVPTSVRRIYDSIWVAINHLGLPL